MAADSSVNGPRGRALWARADRVLPAGRVYISRSARMAGDDVLPGFIHSARGCRLTDVDGREYIDFIGANGPNLLGYAHAEVDAAAATQAQRVDLPSFFPDVIVEFAERLLTWGTGFDWTVLAKNGSDTTALACRIMRCARHRPKIVLFQKAYHGFATELANRFENVPDDAQRHILRLPWNDAQALERTFAEQGDTIAGILLNPLDQNPLQETQSASLEFIAAIEQQRSATGALLALDDVRQGFRLHPRGSHHALGLDPDILCLGKGLANGYATSALLGKAPLREATEDIQFTATYVFSAVAYRAGITTLDVYERDRVFDHLEAMGTRLTEGLTAAAQATGHRISISGPPTMPTLLFANDPKAATARRFAREAALRGAIFHPLLNWFLSAAHREADIDEAIGIAAAAFAATPLP
ncbi:MAG: aminotransferase class III-fold pyridoxal phosphate-dependent enzyme [Pseudomonadota bacterium]